MSPVVNYVRKGAGEPLVLVHGIGSRWQIWEPILDQLSGHFDVVALDLPGFGGSPHPGGAMTVGRLADDVERFCTELGLTRPHVAGNSMGGGIALELGRRGFARSATAFSPIGYWGKPGLAWTKLALRAARALLRPTRGTLPKVLRSAPGRIAVLSLVWGKPARLAPETALAHVDGLLDAPGFEETLASFDGFALDGLGDLTSIPTTIAWGSRDALLIQATQSRRARRQLPTARHVTLRGSGHAPFSDDPQACVDVLLDVKGR